MIRQRGVADALDSMVRAAVSLLPGRLSGSASSEPMHPSFPTTAEGQALKHAAILQGIEWPEPEASIEVLCVDPAAEIRSTMLQLLELVYAPLCRCK